MKLQCHVEVKNRLYVNINVSTNGKYLKSTLALGKEPNSETEYFIIHFSSVNKTGTKYCVKHIKQVFVRYINEGKATIRFEQPPHDLAIKCEQIQLKCFMKLLKSCIVGDTKHLQISSLANLSVTGKDSVPKKLVILDRSDFPIKGLPRTLETLYINGLKLTNFRREILLLKNLTVLDLSNNDIEKIPPEFGRLPNLCELHLAKNNLGENGQIDWRWLLAPQIGQSLKLLDLSGNRLGYLTKSIWKLHRLVTLKLDSNMLTQLPATIGRISNLRYLTISNNELRSLPCSIMQCRLEYIDLSSNKFHRRCVRRVPERHTPWDCYIGSLVNLASKIVLKKKVPYGPNVLPWTLVEFLDNANMCMCGSPVVNDAIFMYREIEIKDYFRTVVFNNSRTSLVSFECYFCSPKCIRM